VGGECALIGITLAGADEAVGNCLTVEATRIIRHAVAEVFRVNGHHHEFSTPASSIS
jgi:hypothetical protein